MTLEKKRKEEILKDFQLHEKDTGSADVQIAMLSEQIIDLGDYLRTNNDHDARLRLLKLVAQRRRLVDYLRSTDTSRYEILVQKIPSIKIKTHKTPEVLRNEDK